jgi:biotin carboxyl carrier protein
MTYRVAIGENEYSVELLQVPGTSGYSIAINGQPQSLDVAEVDHSTFSILKAGVQRLVQVTRLGSQALEVIGQGKRLEVRVFDKRQLRRGRGSAAGAGRETIVSPMFGRVVRVLVSAGEKVTQGQGIAVIEAMKMQNELRSPKDGRVLQLMVKADDAVSTGDVVAEIE